MNAEREALEHLRDTLKVLLTARDGPDRAGAERQVGRALELAARLAGSDADGG